MWNTVIESSVLSSITIGYIYPQAIVMSVTELNVFTLHVWHRWKGFKSNWKGLCKFPTLLLLFPCQTWHFSKPLLSLSSWDIFLPVLKHFISKWQLHNPILHGLFFSHKCLANFLPKYWEIQARRIFVCQCKAEIVAMRNPTFHDFEKTWLYPSTVNKHLLSIFLAKLWDACSFAGISPD